MNARAASEAHRIVANEGKRRGVVLGAADWMCLAGTPVFALMALLSAVVDSGTPYLHCGAEHGSSAMSGMGFMYLLMSILHSAAWLRRIDAQRNGSRRLKPGNV